MFCMRTLCFITFFWAGAVCAQTYPDYKNTTVNDLAQLLSVAEEDRVSDQLNRLKRDTGVEMTVLTIESQSAYAPDQTLEQFATRLFNHWGIGDATRNDGVLVLVIRDDRAMRVELGAAYARDWDRIAEDVIDDHFLPAFRADDYARGILKGSTAVIGEIVMPFQSGSNAPKRVQEAPRQNISEGWIIGLLIAAVLGSNLYSNRSTFSDLGARFRKCPSCGRRGLRADRSVSIPATSALVGRGSRRVYCLYCDYSLDVDYTIGRLTSTSSRGGFGGGSSGGGGGSGRW